MQRIDVIFGPGTGAKFVKGIGIQIASLSGDFIDQDKVRGCVESCGEGPAGGGALSIDSATASPEGRVFVWGCFTQELAFCSSGKLCAFGLKQADGEGGLRFVCEEKVGSISERDRAVRIFPAADELPEVESLVAFDPEDVSSRNGDREGSATACMTAGAKAHVVFHSRNNKRSGSLDSANFCARKVFLRGDVQTPRNPVSVLSETVIQLLQSEFGGDALGSEVHGEERAEIEISEGVAVN